MGWMAELAADAWERERKIAESQILPTDMPDSLDQELTALEHSLGCSFIDSFYAGKASHLVEEEAKAWNQWFLKLNNGDGGVWSELSDRMEALYDAEECYFYDCYRLSIEKDGIACAHGEERHQKFA
ncbi:MAG: hypothetical protein ACYDH4_08665 [Candidatus Cryosericum sp.]